MDSDRILVLLLHGNQLKRTARTGWAQRGIPAPESVADHSYGVIFCALLLTQLIDQPFDLAAVLAMATLHDLPEGLTTDIPAPVWALFPEGMKEPAERLAMETIASSAPAAAGLLDWWEAYRRNESAEAQLVHDADKLDQYLQAYVYHTHFGNRQLDEFWAVSRSFHFPEAQALYEALRSRRESDIRQTPPT